MNDPFKGHAVSLMSPATSAAGVQPSDTAYLEHVTRAIYVGTAGSVSVELVDGSLVTFPNMQGGMIYPLRIKKLRASGTTASGLVGLW